MDSRPATQASTGRHLRRSAIAEAVASDPAQRGVASIGAPGWPSRTTIWGRRTPIWVGLGAVVALTAAVIIGTMLRTGTPRGVTSATSAPVAPATPSAQAPAMPPATAASAAQAGAPVAPAETTNTGTPVSTWDKVAQCESGGNWATSTGNGFHGRLQFTASTWRSFGGSGMPHQASRTEQITVAERVLAAQGWKAWPACSHKLGLR